VQEESRPVPDRFPIQLAARVVHCVTIRRLVFLIFILFIVSDFEKHHRPRALTSSP